MNHTPIFSDFEELKEIIELDYGKELEVNKIVKTYCGHEVEIRGCWNTCELKLYFENDTIAIKCIALR